MANVISDETMEYVGILAKLELKDEEKAELTATTIAMDGIAVIVNKTNELSNITSDQVKGIYTGTITKWADVK